MYHVCWRMFSYLLIRPLHPVMPSNETPGVVLWAEGKNALSEVQPSLDLLLSLDLYDDFVLSDTLLSDKNPWTKAFFLRGHQPMS